MKRNNQTNSQEAKRKKYDFEELCEKIIIAIETGDISTMRSIKSRWAPLFSPLARELPALANHAYLKAASNGDLDTIQFIDEHKQEILIDFGHRNVNKINRIPAFKEAARNGHLDVVNYLLMSDIKTSDTKTHHIAYCIQALRIAAENGHLNVVKRLREETPAGYFSHSRERFAIIDKAVRNGHKDVVKYILKLDSRLYSSYLIEASKTGDTDLIKRFFENYKPVVNAPYEKNYLLAQHRVVIREAISHGQLGAAAMLIYLGVDIDDLDNSIRQQIEEKFLEFRKEKAVNQFNQMLTGLLTKPESDNNTSHETQEEGWTIFKVISSLPIFKLFNSNEAQMNNEAQKSNDDFNTGKAILSSLAGNNKDGHYHSHVIENIISYLPMTVYAAAASNTTPDHLANQAVALYAQNNRKADDMDIDEEPISPPTLGS